MSNRSAAARCLAVVFAALLTAILAPPSFAGFDLWVDPAGALPISFQTINANNFTCAVQESCLNAASGNRRVMRFGNTIVNIGDADLTVGFPPPDGESDENFHWDTCHEHHHLKQIMRYEPVNASGVVTVGRKQNFCMADSEPWAEDAPPSAHDCNGPQGITRGWSDIYMPNLDCQWLDITGIPNGVYTLRLTVDPLNKYAEDDETNNVTERVVVLQQAVGVEPPAIVSGASLELIGTSRGRGAESVRYSTGPFAGRASIAVYDLRGALRRTLLDREAQTGEAGQVPWARSR